MKSAEFKDQQLEDEFNNSGVVNIPAFLDKHEVGMLRNLFASCYNYAGEEQGMWNSLYNISPDSSSEVSSKILETLKSKLDATFKNYKTPVASFMAKNPNMNGVTELHRDFSIQDESVFQYRNIWIPLVDTTRENGALYALKYSHNLFNYPLPMFCKWPYLEHKEMLFSKCDIIESKAGDLVVYADRTLHGSFINKTKEVRPVVHFGLLHPDAALCYYYLNEETKHVSMYDVPFSFFFQNSFGNQDGKYPLSKQFQFAPPMYSEADIVSGLKK